MGTFLSIIGTILENCLKAYNRRKESIMDIINNCKGGNCCRCWMSNLKCGFAT